MAHEGYSCDATSKALISVRRVSLASYRLSEDVDAVVASDALVSHACRFKSQRGGLDVLCFVHGEADTARLRAQATSGVLRLLVGDASEFEGTDLRNPYGNLVQIEIDLFNGRVEFCTSLVGLPPLFVLRDSRGIALGAPMRPDPSHGMRLSGPDISAAADVLRWGHPIENRTLAANLSLVPACSRGACGPHGAFSIQSLHEHVFKSRFEEANDQSIIEMQIAAFLESTQRLNLKDAVVSLSGGLDSRAVAVAALKRDPTLLCVTLAANQRSLDYQLAREFCAAHGANHRMISTGTQFRAGLAERIVEAGRLTLGVDAVSQSVDLYLYEQLGLGVRSRISGNLGNQVGRGGVESLSVAHPPQAVLSAELCSELESRPLEPWYLRGMQQDGFARTLFTQEVNYWSTANYVLGSSFATQVSPYANRTLIHLSSLLFAARPGLSIATTRSLRKRDTLHRLAGPPADYSFQRRYLAQAAGRARRVAINWGWLADGGWSARWVARALPTVASAALLKFAPKSNGLRNHLPPFGLVDWRVVVKSDLQELVRDVLSSSAVVQSGLFNAQALSVELDRYFGADASPHHGSVIRMLEIGLACTRIKSESTE